MHLSIDIETLGTSSNSVILSIGAIAFDKHGVDTNFAFEINIDPDSCAEAGLVIDARTVMWWMDQSDKARNKITGAKTVPLMTALSRFKDAFTWKGMTVWCNGADFDFPIISNAFKAVGDKEPWEYWSKRDYRTLKNLVNKDVYNALKVEPSIAHSALADAVAQAKTTIQLFDHLGLEL